MKEPWMKNRNDAIRAIAGLGNDDEARKIWKMLTGYHRRPLGETTFTYDPLGRRLSKTIFIKTTFDWEKSNHEDYLYDDQDEIGAFENPNTPKNFRVLGNHLNTIAIEINNQHFAPITDIQGNICCLIDPKTKT